MCVIALRDSDRYKKDPVAHHGFAWTFRGAQSTVAKIYVRAVNVVGQGAPSNKVVHTYIHTLDILLIIIC